MISRAISLVLSSSFLVVLCGAAGLVSYAPTAVAQHTDFCAGNHQVDDGQYIQGTLSAKKNDDGTYKLVFQSWNGEVYEGTGNMNGFIMEFKFPSSPGFASGTWSVNGAGMGQLTNSDGDVLYTRKM